MNYTDISSNVFSLCLPYVKANLTRDTIWKVFEKGLSLGRVVEIDMIPRKNLETRRINCSFDERDSFLVFVHLYWNKENSVAVRMSQTISTGGQVKLHYRKGGFWWVKASSIVNHSFVEFLEENKSIGGKDEHVSKFCQESYLKGTPNPPIKSSTTPPMPLEKHLENWVPIDERISGIFYDCHGVAKGWYPSPIRPASEYHYGWGHDENGINYYEWEQGTLDNATPLQIIQLYASVRRRHLERRKKGYQSTTVCRYPESWT